MDAKQVFHTGGKRGDGNIVLYVVGELEATSAPVLREALRGALANGTALVVVDCSHLTFIDTAGLGVLVWAANQARGLGKTLELRNQSAAIDEVLRLTGIGGFFAVVDSRPPIALTA